MKSLVLGLMAAGACGAAEISYTADQTVSTALTLTENTTITVAKGVTVTCSGAISGDYTVTKAGLGTLVLATANAPGAWVLQEGCLKTTDAQALGSAPITFNARTTSTTNQLWIAAADTTLEQDITFTRNGLCPDSGTYASTAVANFAPIRITATGVVFNGNLTSAVNTGVFAKSAGTVTFNGTITTTNKKFSPWAQAQTDVFAFKNKIDLGTGMFSIANWDFSGRIELYSPQNVFGTLFISRQSIRCCAANVLGAATVTWSNVNKSDAVGNGRLDLNGYDQTITTVTWSSGTKPGTADAGTPVFSASPATLTIAQNTNSENWVRFADAVSVVYAATGNDYTMTCRERTHETTGSFAVRSGILAFTGGASLKNVGAVSVESGATLSMNVTAVHCLAAVTNVSVAGTLAFAATATAPFLCTNRVALAIAAGGKLTIPSGVELLVTKLTVAGEAYGEGAYTKADLPSAIDGDGTLRVVFRAESADPVDVTWTAGGGTDTSVATDANWDDAANKPMSSIVGPRPVFASAGSVAVLSDTRVFNGIVFTQTNGFTIATNSPTALIRLMGPTEGATVSAADAAAAYTSTIAAPVELLANQVVQPGTNATIAFTGGLSGYGCGFAMQGAKLSTMANDYATNGCVILENPRTTGPITHTQGGGWLVLRGEIGQPGDTSAMTLDFGRYKAGNSSKYGWTELGNTRWEGVTCYKQVDLQGGGHQSVATGVRSWCQFAAGTTNVFKKPVTQMCTTGLLAENDAVVVFEDGYLATAGGVYLDGASSSTRPSTYVFNGPMTERAGDREFDSGNGYSRHVFHCTNNYARLFYCLRNVTVEFPDTDDAFRDTSVYFAAQNATIDLYGTRQRFNDVQNRNDSRGTVKGVWPATLEIMKGQPSAACCVKTNFHPQVTGWVTLKMCGSGYLLLTNRVYASYGDLAVTNGTLEIARNASWPNGTNVTVSGTGTLKIGSSATFTGEQAILYLAENGKLDLAAGVLQAFNEAYVMDASGVEKRVHPGVYSYQNLDSAGLLADHFAATSAGAIRIRGQGTLVLFR